MEQPKEVKRQVVAITGKARLLAVIVVLFATLMDILDTTIVNIALPTIQNDLHTSYSLLQWVLVGYTLTFAVLLILGGRLGDIFGYKKLFMIGVASFGMVSLLCGIAPNVETLVGLRVLQGVAAALMVPQATSLIQLLYSPKERGKVMGLFGAIGGLAAVFGPIVGGILLDANIGGYGWRPLFLVNVPVTIIALIAGYFLLPKGKSPHPLRLDIVGTLLVITALSAFVLPLIQGPDLHWPLWTVVTLITSIPLFLAFVLYEKRHNKRTRSSLVEPSLFKQATFTRGVLLNMMFQIILAGLLLTFTLILQQYLHYSPIKAALTNLPMIVGTVLGVAVLGEMLVSKIGRYVITLGSTLMAVGMVASAWIFNHYGAALTPWEFAPSLLFTGIGMGLIAGPLFAITLQHVDKAHVGSASGIVEAVDQLGGVLGVVIIGTLFLNQIQHGFNQAYVWATIGCIIFAALIFAVSFLLPKKFKSEAELDFER